VNTAASDADLGRVQLYILDFSNLRESHPLYYNSRYAGNKEEWHANDKKPINPLNLLHRLTLLKNHNQTPFRCIELPSASEREVSPCR
jgi:hypothetical protein